jgi:hypothetical protein
VAGDHHELMHAATDMAGALEHVRTHSAGAPVKVSSKQIRRDIHGGSIFGRFNNRLALIITKIVGTMWAAYVFALIALVSLPEAIKAYQDGNMVVAVGWLSTSFLQLVLLPIIIVGQNVISAHQDARSETDHETLTALHAINVHQLEILETQHHILEELEKRKASARTD